MTTKDALYKNDHSKCSQITFSLDCPVKIKNKNDSQQTCFTYQNLHILFFLFFFISFKINKEVLPLVYLYIQTTKYKKQVLLILKTQKWQEKSPILKFNFFPINKSCFSTGFKTK
jgi:hypothetical protein